MLEVTGIPYSDASRIKGLTTELDLEKMARKLAEADNEKLLENLAGIKIILGQMTEAAKSHNAVEEYLQERVEDLIVELNDLERDYEELEATIEELPLKEWKKAEAAYKRKKQEEDKEDDILDKDLEANEED